MSNSRFRLVHSLRTRLLVRDFEADVVEEHVGRRPRVAADPCGGVSEADGESAVDHDDGGSPGNEGKTPNTAGSL